MQVENPDAMAVYPAMFVMPATQSFFSASGRRSSSIAGSLRRQQALTGRLAVWQHRQGGVLCIERAELHLAAFALEVSAVQIRQRCTHASA